MNDKEALYNYCLRLGDNALIHGHRLSELCSRGPFLEEDLALTNTSLDLIGRAHAVFKYAAELEQKGRDEDDIAYRREERNYYNVLITEQPNGDFANVVVKQLFLSSFEILFFTELAKSKDATLAGIAQKTLKEVKYHLQHSSDWTVRLGDGTEESHRRMQNAVNKLWMCTGELFEMDELDRKMAEKGIGVDVKQLQAKWNTYIQEVISEATLVIPEKGFMQSGGKKGVHSEHMGHILAEMQYLQRAYPDAKW